MTDRELLAQYRSGSGEAFAEIVRRHAGMVHANCRRILGDAHAADDAAQATFLVLVRKAPKLSPGTVLADWLFLTSRYAALDLKRKLARQRDRDREGAMISNSEVSREASAEWSEVGPVLDTAMAKLPRAQRRALVLCYLEGKSQEEVAVELGCPRSTVATWVARGLERLRGKLRRLGVTVGAAALPALLIEKAAPAAPAALAASIEAACLGTAAASSSALSAMGGAMKTMMWMKAKVVTSAVFAAAVVGGGGGLAVRQLAAAEAGSGKMPANAWVQAPRTEKIKKLKHFAGMISGRPKAKTANWRFQAKRAFYSSSAQGAWIPDRKSVLFVSGNAYSGSTTWLYDPAVGGDWNRSLAGREQPKGWTDLKVGKEVFKGGFRWTSMCYDPVNKEVLLFGGNCALPGGSPGTMTFDLAKKVWTRLDVSKSPLAPAHAKCEELRLAARRLEGRMRSRWHLGETPEEAKVDLGKVAGELAAKAKKLIAALPAGGTEDKEALGLARGELSAVVAGLKSMGASVNAAETAKVASAAERLRAARDFLAPEPTGRANSQLAWDAKHKKMVLFGGDHLDYMFADTWTYDPARRRWSQRFPEVSPAPRGGHALVYLPKSGKLALLGGYAYRSDEGYGGMGYDVRFPELWVYDTGANKWGLLKHWLFGKNRHGRRSAREGIEGGGPASPHNKALQAVASEDDVILCGKWACRVDASAIDAAGTARLGAKRGAVARRTGKYVPAFWDEGPRGNAATSEGKLKSIPANTWTKITPPKTLNRNRDWGTATFDTDRGQILYFSGGHCAYSGTDVHVYSSRANRWRTSSFADFPVGFCAGTGYHAQEWSFSSRPFMTSHTYKLYAYDPGSRKMLCYNRSNTFVFDPLACDWEPEPIKNTPFGGGHWIPKFCTTPDGLLVWSTAKGRGRDRPSGLWRFDSANRAWQQIKTSGVKVPTTPSDDYGTLVYDSKRKRALMFVSSRSPGGPWACDPASGAVANLKASNPKAGPQQPREAIYLPGADVVLFIETKGTAAIVYDCAKNKFRLLEIANPLKGKPHGYGLMWDPKRGLAWAVQCNKGWTIQVMRFDPKTARFIEAK